jgi:hypothetical protein
MSAIVVRCPACGQLSRVPESAVGLMVACPRCPHQFTAAPHGTVEPAVPTVRPRNPVLPVPPPPQPKFDPFADDEPPVVRPHTAGGGPVAIALVPIGIPLLWLLLTLVRKSVFTFAAPVAIAVGVCALGFGLVAVRRWSAAVRTRAVIALVALAYLSSGVLYFAQPGWLEGVRALVSRTGLIWKEYRPDDRTFSVRVPGDPKPGDSPVPGWNLTTVRVVDPKKPVDVFVVAHGTPPKDVPVRAGDDEWFGRVKDAVLEAAGGTLVREQPLVLGEMRVRDYELQLPGDATAKRVVRVMRSGGRLYYLAVDSPWVTLDATDVRQFWESFKLTKK